MSTLGVMKARIASEFRRDDLSADIANAITTAINAYKYERFPFNRAGFVDAPANDTETDNPWMTTAERLIRCRAKLEVAVNVIKYDATDSFPQSMLEEVNDALTQLRISLVQSTTAVPGTLGAMKVRIANEINRGDLDPEIADAINAAIDYWSGERYFFNETRDTTFQTIADQDSYGINEFNDILNVIKIDYMMCITGGLPDGQSYDIVPRFPRTIERSIQSGAPSRGIPSEYTFYNQTIRLYPVPSSPFDVRIAYQRSIPAPVQNDETGNAWMTVAERMIRAQAKAELYKHVEALVDDGKAAKYATLADDESAVLSRKTTKMTQVGGGRVLPYG